MEWLEREKHGILVLDKIQGRAEVVAPIKPYGATLDKFARISKAIKMTCWLVDYKIHRLQLKILDVLITSKVAWDVPHVSTYLNLQSDEPSSHAMA